jgi:hypothetical protein
MHLKLPCEHFTPQSYKRLLDYDDLEGDEATFAVAVVAHLPQLFRI